jgi:hypothetical protein
VHKEYKKVYRKRMVYLVSGGKNALYDYTTNGYTMARSVLNPTLRGQSSSEEGLHLHVDGRVRAVCRAMRKIGFRKQYEGIVRRRCQELPASVMEGLREGTTFSDAGFFSTSYDKGFSGSPVW